MNSSSDSHLTPIEVRQNRSLVLAFDLALWSIILGYLSLAIPTMIAMIDSMMSQGMGSNLTSQIRPIGFWLAASSNGISIASAFLFLGAPRRMRCFWESIAYAMLCLLSSLLFSLGHWFPITVWLSVVAVVNALLLIPLVQLLLLRKAAIFIESSRCMALGRSIAWLMMAGIVLVELWSTIPVVNRYFDISLEYFAAFILAPVLSLVGAIVCFALVSFRLFRMQRLLKQEFIRASSLQASDRISSIVKGGAPQTELAQTGHSPRPFSWGYLKIRLGLWWALAIPLFLIATCEVGKVWIQTATQMEQRGKEDAARAFRFNAELWEKVRRSAARPLVDQANVREMASICARYPKWEYFNTLGVAQYRIGDYSAAKETLMKSMNSSRSTGDPSDLAFLAMVLFKLGDQEQARRFQERLSDALKMPKYRNDVQGHDFSREVDALFNGTLREEESAKTK